MRNVFFFSSNNLVVAVYIFKRGEEKCLRFESRPQYKLVKRWARLSAFFIALTFENYERYFFYEILVLNKSKNINVFLFFLMTRKTIFIIEKVV